MYYCKGQWNTIQHTGREKWDTTTTIHNGGHSSLFCTLNVWVSLRANSPLARSHARSLATWLASLATQSVGIAPIAWHRHQRDCWNKTEHYYSHCAHLIPKRKACLQATVTKRRLSCCYFSYYGCLPFFCECPVETFFSLFFCVFFFQLEASFTANVAAIEANCARVEARMNALLEKFETKGRW